VKEPDKQTISSDLELHSRIAGNQQPDGNRHAFVPEEKHSRAGVAKATSPKPQKSERLHILLVDVEESIWADSAADPWGTSVWSANSASLTEALAEIGASTYDVLVADLNVEQEGDGRQGWNLHQDSGTSHRMRFLRSTAARETQRVWNGLAMQTRVNSPAPHLETKKLDPN
jgi:hypothetical protein